MGQKVNPHGLRVGVIKDWDSRWYASEEKVGDLIVEDQKIRKYLKKTLYGAGVPKIEIERSNDIVTIYLHCARPGVVIGKGGEHPLFGRTNVTARKAFLNELRDMVTTLYNHPCIAMWVPFNEGWGQFDSQTAVQVIRSVDKTRTIDPASGWHDQGFGDVRSLHVYFQKYKFQPDKLGRATLLSEFGGYIHRVEGHAMGGRSVGYKTCDAPLSLEYALQALYDEQIRPAIAQGLSAAVYTQLSDVEHELNGLVTYDRSVVKLPVQTLRKIFYIENE